MNLAVDDIKEVLAWKGLLKSQMKSFYCVLTNIASGIKQHIFKRSQCSQVGPYFQKYSACCVLSSSIPMLPLVGA